MEAFPLGLLEKLGDVFGGLCEGQHRREVGQEDKQKGQGPLEEAPCQPHFLQLTPHSGRINPFAFLSRLLLGIVRGGQ